LQISNRRPSPALIVALIALVAALAGTATALPGKNQVDKNDLKKGAVTKKALKKGAVTKKAIKKDAVTTKAIKAGAVTNDKLAPQEPVHLVGAPGEPAFGNGGENDCIWSNITALLPPGTPSPFSDAGFFKDSSGVVHLSGAAVAQDGPGGDGACDDPQDAIAYALPAGYRPPKLVTQSTIVAGSGTPEQQMLIGANEAITFGPTTFAAGQVGPNPVDISDGLNMSFDGITFRAVDAGNASAPASGGARSGEAGAGEVLNLP
jgi:hypothetical protein